ncbi:MAG TPA: tRNA (adenosine(37)-N6)-dimethylallyltransferase MiaA [Gaiellaceae bacterium]|nr:tRNA (adenosine(37)-N6)-dimethylallyltransferase MiaA [Gaiellaceae bacterium]
MTELVLAIFGPTGSGKSGVAQALAERIPAEIVSADSMQVYRGLPILTNQSPGRLVGIWPLEHEASVGEYQQLAHAAIDEILASGRTPVVVGGTGLYLRAALADLSIPPAPEPGARERWEELYDREGAERAHAMLALADPEAAAAVHLNDRRRVVRGLELAGLGRERERLWTDETRHPTLVFGLEVDKAELERRLAVRARAMFDAGVRQEVERALAAGISPTARYAHGIADVAEHPDDDAAIEAIVARGKRYAAYQRKWMRRIPSLVSLPADRPPGDIADAILEVARARQRLPAGRAG